MSIKCTLKAFRCDSAVIVTLEVERCAELAATLVSILIATFFCLEIRSDYLTTSALSMHCVPLSFRVLKALSVSLSVKHHSHSGGP